ncbi:DNA polymerase III, subunit gamma and tau [Candidatus Peregrinibacteria bacterium RIFCSPLOWO2_02_FULL_39_10]|nr:MAG: DNA polymerase III, subunit gamma and tau [Candidatus Peregrinibacteria bacterium RIFCSPLOWO2_02_FULL_39_10]
MENISLYRKYRPHNFDNLVGQDHIKTTLINAIKGGNVSHAYLFTGPRGTGKTSTARLVAKALTCKNLLDGFEPCGECDFCSDISEGRLIDLIEIDAASNRGIDEVRDLKEKINFAPTRAKVKIYIVDEVHMMTKEAFNALLKTLEEPPHHAYFILATTEVHKIPETIISRCQRFDFKRISIRALMTRLSFIAQKEEIEAEDGALEMISKYVDGGLRDAIGLLEQLTVEKKLSASYVQDILGVSDSSMLTAFFNAIMARDTKESLNVINELHSQGSDLKQFSHEFMDFVRTKMLQSIINEENEIAGRYLKIIEIFQEAHQKLESSIPQLPLEIAAIQTTGTFKDVNEGQGEVSNGIEKEEAIKKENVKKDRAEDAKSAEDLSSLPLTIDSLMGNWPRVVERIKTAPLRMSLMSGKPLKVEGINVVVEFDTIFHKDKVMEHSNRTELEETITRLFNSPVKMSAAMKAIELKPVVEEQSDDIEKVLEIFGGGEVVG